MAEYTKNLNLKKPAPDDFVDVADLNGNFDVIDEKIAEAAEGGKQYYGTCTTAAATAAKVVTADRDFVLETGAAIDVKFSYANSAASPTLNVGGTGAKYIKKYGNTAPNTYQWYAGAMVRFVYDGTYWIMEGGTIATTTYYGVTKLNSSTSSTSTTEAATSSAVKAAMDKANAALPKAGGTMTGNLVLNADPTANLGAATKQYVDRAVPIVLSFTIPAGRLRGDVNGDGEINQTDVAYLTANQTALNNLPADDVNRLAADYIVDGNNVVNGNDASALTAALGNARQGIYGFTDDVLGKWFSNAIFTEEERQFYTDITINGIGLTGSNVIITTKKDGFSAEIIATDKLRIWCVKPPIKEVAAAAIVTPIEGATIVTVVPKVDVSLMDERNVYVFEPEGINDDLQLYGYMATTYPLGYKKINFRENDIIIMSLINMSVADIDCTYITIDDIKYQIRMPNNVIVSQLSTPRRIFYRGVYIMVYQGGKLFVLNPSNFETMKFRDVSVPVDSWIQNSNEYAEFPCRAAVITPRVDTNYTPDVRFDYDDAMSGNFASFAKIATSHYVYIYAKTVPTEELVIPVIICEKVPII